MAINETKNNTYRVRRKYPKDVADILNLKNRHYDKIFKTLNEAQIANLEFDENIKEVRRTQNASVFELKGDILFKDFYENVWLDYYQTGYTTSNQTPPTDITIKNTKDLFRLHILPLFGTDTLNYLNNSLPVVLHKMTKKSREYANFKIIRCYVNQLFDLAEELEYIKHNRLEKPLKKIKSLKKIQLAEKRNNEDKYLTKSELLLWLQAIEHDFENNLITPQDYTMFWTTFLLNCRKSECYALKWKHVNFEENLIHLEQNLDKKGNVKSTKGKKTTDITIPPKLRGILINWKNQQALELKQFGIEQKSNQFLFTFCDSSGNVNRNVHIDFLNYRMNSIARRHPELKHASPHTLRHTAATLAKKYGMSLDAIQEGLTHSDRETTRIYINDTPHVKTTPASYVLEKFS